MDGQWNIQELEPSRHYCGGLSCGKPRLDAYLKQSANNEAQFGLNKTYVAIEPDGEKVEGQAIVVGFYTSGIATISCEIAASVGCKNPREYPALGVIHLGRIATDVEFQGQGLGSFMMMHMMHQAMAVADIVGSVGINLFAEQEVVPWYKKQFGFKVVEQDHTGDKNHMFIDMGMVRSIFKGQASTS